jgi:hypothetical protein
MVSIHTLTQSITHSLLQFPRLLHNYSLLLSNHANTGPLTGKKVLLTPPLTATMAPSSSGWCLGDN